MGCTGRQLIADNEAVGDHADSLGVWGFSNIDWPHGGTETAKVLVDGLSAAIASLATASRRIR
jgi:hypothetical protein